MSLLLFILLCGQSTISTNNGVIPMRSTIKYFLPIAFLAIFSFTTFGQSSNAGVKPYDIVEVEKFTVADGVDFPEKELDELVTYLVLNMNRSKRFDQVFLTTDTAAESAPAHRARISGVVTKYSKGNRAARYLVGFGAGRTKLVADVKVTDVETGETLLELKADGHVYGGLFGGATDQAKGNLSSEIIKKMTKLGLASKTRKK